MNKDLLVGIGAIIAPVILVFAALTYVSEPAVLGTQPAPEKAVKHASAPLSESSPAMSPGRNVESNITRPAK